MALEAIQQHIGELPPELVREISGGSKALLHAPDLYALEASPAAEAAIMSLRGLVAALQGGDVTTSISGLAEIIASAVRESCDGQLELKPGGCELTSARLQKGFRILSALATYGASYRKRGATESDADFEKARADERRKAIESLIDSVTDRTDREGEWVVSLGADVAVGAQWLGESYSGHDLRLNRNPISLRTGIAVQKLTSFGFHGMLSVFDLAQYAALEEKGAELETPEPSAATALRLGLEIGASFGSPAYPIVVAVDGAWLPAMEVAGSGRGVWSAGASVGVYVPFVDLN